MTDERDELRTLHERLRALHDRADRIGDKVPLRSPRMVAQVYDGGEMPTAAGRFYNTYPVTVKAGATEGSQATMLVHTEATVVMRVVGGVPDPGDFVLGHNVNYRWEAEFFGHAPEPGKVISGCPCTSIPATLYMHSSDPVGNNGIFQDATFVWGPTPAALMPLAIGANTFLSDAEFLDLSNGDHYRYLLTCYFGYYILTRVYETSVFGSPYRDTIRYRWLAGYTGNTCTPFRLSNGQIFSGGDPSLVLEINTTP